VRRSGCIVSEIREDGSVWIGVQLRRDEDPMLGHLLDDVAQSARLGTVGLDYFHTTLWFVPDFDPRKAAAIIETLRTTPREPHEIANGVIGHG
jgi:2'-5' RNA ligase